MGNRTQLEKTVLCESALTSVRRQAQSRCSPKEGWLSRLVAVQLQLSDHAGAEVTVRETLPARLNHARHCESSSIIEKNDWLNIIEITIKLIMGLWPLVTHHA